MPGARGLQQMRLRHPLIPRQPEKAGVWEVGGRHAGGRLVDGPWLVSVTRWQAQALHIRGRDSC